MSSSENSQAATLSDIDSGNDEDEKKYSTGAPLRRFDLTSFVECQQMIIQDTYHHYYVTSDWTPEFYRLLAHAGFISVAQDEYLIPEIQTYYCILDFPNLHIPKKTRKIARRYVRKMPHLAKPLTHIHTASATSSSVVKDTLPVRLRMFANRDSALCIRKIQEYWGDKNWLSDRYMSCLQASGLEVYTFELYLEVEEEEEGGGGHSLSLLAGEVGYIIGGVYTSLTGFHVGGCPGHTGDEDKDKEQEQEEEEEEGQPEGQKIRSSEPVVLTRDIFLPAPSSSASSKEAVLVSSLPPVPLLLPKDLSRCCGTLQLAALGCWLQASDFSFWNLGHPPRKVSMRYKRDLGGAVFPRGVFLKRWHQAINLPAPRLCCLRPDSDANESPTDAVRSAVNRASCFEMDLASVFWAT